jgi:hypothetical protein
LNKDEILQALRLTAMGRAGHPLQEQLAEKLELAFHGYDEWSKAIAAAPVVDIPTPTKRAKKAE